MVPRSSRSPPPEPTTAVHPREWWNSLIGNRGAYVSSPGAVAHVSLGLPRAEFLPFGPDWVRGRIPLFFGIVIAFSLLLTLFWRLR
jgi:hypothetical protein